jgi:hypothetical protein
MRSLSGAELDFRLFRHFERVIDLDPKITTVLSRLVCPSSRATISDRGFEVWKEASIF